MTGAGLEIRDTPVLGAKAVVEREADRILGRRFLVAQGGEVAAVIQMAMLGGLPASALRDAFLACPTVAQGSTTCSPAGRTVAAADATPPGASRAA